MGFLRFSVPQPDRISEDAVERAYVVGFDGVPWQSRNELTDGQLTIQRPDDDSGSFYIPWPIEGHGELILSTANLMERDRPYHLPLELARGTVNRIRNQRAAWEAVGLVVPDEVTTKTRRAVSLLTEAIMSLGDAVAAAERAEQSIAVAMEVIDLLGAQYTEQALALRHEQSSQLNTLMAANLEHSLPGEGAARTLLAAFNTAVVPLVWQKVEVNMGDRVWNLPDRQIQWCHEQGLKVVSGPLLQVGHQSLPDWLYLWGNDFEQLHSYMQGHVAAVVQRYRGKVHLWHSAAKLNTDDPLTLNEGQKLRLAADSIEIIRRTDPRTPVIVSFDQPWGEYLRREPFDLSPIHFCDALVRADVGLSGIGLEINLGYWPGGTLPRDLLDFSNQVDRWSLFGLPLLILLTTPSSDGDDPNAHGEARALTDGTAEGVTPTTQQAIVERLIPMLLAKQPVQGILWNQLHDGAPHGYPHGGLFDSQGRPKPALSTLSAIRSEHLE